MSVLNFPPRYRSFGKTWRLACVLQLCQRCCLFCESGTLLPTYFTAIVARFGDSYGGASKNLLAPLTQYLFRQCTAHVSESAALRSYNGFRAQSAPMR